jgi:uncharacterized protein (DUF2147 family)
MKLIISLLSILTLGHASAYQPADAILGTWYTEENKAQIEIYEENGVYSGKIVWLKEPLNEQGKPKTDKENSNKALRSRPIIGMNLLQGFKFNGSKWEGGEIYDPENGKTYSSVIKLDGKKLEVRGFVGASFFGKTVVWNREKP